MKIFKKALIVYISIALIFFLVKMGLYFFKPGNRCFPTYFLWRIRPGTNWTYNVTHPATSYEISIFYLESSLIWPIELSRSDFLNEIGSLCKD